MSDLEHERRINKELIEKIGQLSNDLEQKEFLIQELKRDFEKQRNFQTTQSLQQHSPSLHLNKKSSILSGSRRDSVNMNLTRSSQDYNALVDQNNELNDALVIMQDEVTYLKLREKKIMYLVHLMQGKGYPITQIFEQQVKPIDTLRFDEFLNQKEIEQQREDELNAQVDFSFRSDDSFELLVVGPQMKPRKPDCIPLLNFEGLPEYVTSSEEGGESEKEEQQ